ncbi:hypothetical protein B0A48_02921 [Cryoendolithus antarcticus]|uniref:Uncharacterized protein n=1 Tax=Cryoendolithus antarcticus TaxID=1507870 RepID=A0A1V8TLM8_9PEZI|nr:hypothetical protein B0A48_02921 [Cryoendolithus antarcticus]
MAGPTMEPQQDLHLLKVLAMDMLALRARCDSLETQNFALTTEVATLRSNSTQKTQSITNGNANGHVNGNSETEDFTQEIATAINARFAETTKKLVELEALCNNSNTSIEELFKNVQKIEAKPHLNGIGGGPLPSLFDISPTPKIVRGADEPGSHWQVYFRDQIDRLNTKADGTASRTDQIDRSLKSTTELALSVIKARLDKLEKSDTELVDQRRQERLIDDTRQQGALRDIFCALDEMKTMDNERHVAGMFAGTSIELEALQNRVSRRLALLENTVGWLEWSKKQVELRSK